MSPQCIISTHSTKVLFLGQLLGISVIFPAMWLPAAFRGQGTGATSKGRVWMAMLTVVPITLVECTGWFQPVAGSFCLFCAWFLNLMGRKEAIVIFTRLFSIVASVSYMMIWCIFAWQFGICNKRELSETDNMDKHVHLICFFRPIWTSPFSLRSLVDGPPFEDAGARYDLILLLDHENSKGTLWKVHPPSFFKLSGFPCSYLPFLPANMPGSTFSLAILQPEAGLFVQVCLLGLAYLSWEFCYGLSPHQVLQSWLVGMECVYWDLCFGGIWQSRVVVVGNSVSGDLRWLLLGEGFEPSVWPGAEHF